MPTTRSSGRINAASATSTTSAVGTSGYNLRSNRPSAGFYAGMDDEPELTSADYAAASALVAMRSSAAVSAVSAVTQRRSARIAARA